MEIGKGFSNPSGVSQISIYNAFSLKSQLAGLPRYGIHFTGFDDKILDLNL